MEFSKYGNSKVLKWNFKEKKYFLAGIFDLKCHSDLN
jgi:hypothetical protein